MQSYQELIDLDNFFYYGLGDLVTENAADLWVLLFQNKNGLFYNRAEGGGISEFENAPLAFSTQILLKFNVASAVARRNQIVANGQSNMPDRRIAVSQTSINIQQNDNGEMDVNVLYFNYFDFKTPSSLLFPLRGVI